MEIHVRLVFTSKNLHPNQISDAIGIKGDQIWAAGEKRSITETVETENGLIAESDLMKCFDSETHIEGMVKAFSGLEERFAKFSATPDCEIQLSCMIYSSSAPSLNFEKLIISWIGSIGASLDIDLFLT